jgi:hypothetical protein
MKKVSIIIACYNQAQFVKQAVNSAFQQKYENKEIIVINDGSTDDTRLILLELERKYKIQVINQENKGVIAARNRAIEASTGDYIICLDGDDYFASNDVVSEMVNKMQQNQDCGVVYGNYEKFGAEKGLVQVKTGNIGHFLAGCNMSVTSLIRKDLFMKVGGFAEYMKDGFEDTELFVRLIQSCEFAKVDKVIFNYRILNNSRNKQAMTKRNEVFLNIIRNNKEIYSNNLEEFYLEIIKEKEELYKRIKKLNKKRKLLTKALIAVVLIALALGIQCVKH